MWLKKLFNWRQKDPRPTESLTGEDLAGLSAKELRDRLGERYRAFQPHERAMQEHARVVLDLSVAFQKRRLQETFQPSGVLPHMTLAFVFDCRWSPATFEKHLKELRGSALKVRALVFDPVHYKTYLFI